MSLNIQNNTVGNTTVMLRNIPNHLNVSELKAELRKFDFMQYIDYLYLPLDFVNGQNVGYAFINFTTPEAALIFLATFTNHKINVAVGGPRKSISSNKSSSTCSKQTMASKSSSKACQVSWARVQGLLPNIMNFLSAPIRVDYLPTVFNENGDEMDFGVYLRLKEYLQQQENLEPLINTLPTSC